MRLLLVVLMLVAPALAIDISRVSVHELDAQLVDHATYYDNFYGQYAAYVGGWIESYGGELSFVRSRLPPGFNVTSFEVNVSNETSTVMATGVNDGFVVKKDELWKVSGKGFIDRICDDLQPEVLARVEQEFESRATLPEGFVVVRVPESKASNNTFLDYDYRASLEGREFVERLHLEVKKDADVVSYCNERAELEEVLKQGLLVGRKPPADTGTFAILGGLLAVGVVIAFIAWVIKARAGGGGHEKSVRGRVR